MNTWIQPVDLQKSYRLLNHGPTVLISAEHDGDVNVMSAAWACALDFAPSKVTVVVDKISQTRKLIEGSGFFTVQVPTLKQLQLVDDLGNISKYDDADKLRTCNAPIFKFDNFDAFPVVAECSGWLLCKLIPEPHNQETYDLFIGEVVAAFSDTRVFKDGHWNFDDANDDMKSVHHVSGGHYYAIGKAHQSTRADKQ